MKTNFLIICTFFHFFLSAQVPENGLTTDGKGNIFVALHAPEKLIYDGFMLPVSAKKSTYVLKLDANGDLAEISPATGTATIAGPIFVKNDTVFFVQAVHSSSGANSGEIVLTKMNVELSHSSTVTFPLPTNARPVAGYYHKNHWAFVYVSNSGNKFVYTLAGISHLYADKWMKSITPYHVSGIIREGEDMVITGTYMNAFRFDGREMQSGGADVFLLGVEVGNGAYQSLRGTTATNILNTYLCPKGDDFWVTGSLLTTDESGINSSILYAGIVKSNLNSEKLMIPVSGDFSESRAIAASTTGGAYVLGNFSGQLDLGGGYHITASEEINNDVFLLKMDAEASVSWIKSFGSAGPDEAIAISPMPDGGILFVYTEGSEGSIHAYTNDLQTAPKAGRVKVVRLDNSGAVIWEKLLETKSK